MPSCPTASKLSENTVCVPTEIEQGSGETRLLCALKDMLGLKRSIFRVRGRKTADSGTASFSVRSLKTLAFECETELATVALLLAPWSLPPKPNRLGRLGCGRPSLEEELTPPRHILKRCAGLATDRTVAPGIRMPSLRTQT